MTDPKSPEQAEAEQAAREERITSAIEKLASWPLSRRETFAAFNLMGLSSRLQPVQVDSTEHQTRVVTLAFKLADMALNESDKQKQ